MNVLFLLVPIALGMGTLALVAYFWALKTGQYDDIEGSAVRILIDDENDLPVRDNT